MKSILLKAALAAVPALGMMSPAQALPVLPDIALGATAGSLGVGAQATIGLLPILNARVSVQGLGFSPGFDRDGVDYNGKVKLLTYGAYLDVYPLTRWLRLSAGVVGNQNRLGLKAPCGDSCDIGDGTISDSTGLITGRLAFNSVAPYVGIGFSNPLAGSPFYVGGDVGVLFQGRPKVRLAATGTATLTSSDGSARENVDLATDPEFQQDLSAESDDLSDTTREYRFYPVIQFNIGWRF